MVVHSFVPSRPALRDFAWTLIRTNFKARYHGELSGFVWALLKPLLMFVVLTFVFSNVFRNSGTYTAHLLIGLVIWDFFAEGTKVGIESLMQSSFLLTKARLPSWIIVVTSMANAALSLLIFASIVLTYVCIAHGAPSVVGLLFFAFYLLQLILIVIGFSLAFSAVMLFYRDLNQVWDVVLQAGFFVAPIVYPLKIIPEKVHFYLYLWPVTPIVQFSRDVIVEGSIPTLRAHLLLGALTVFSMGLGILVSRRWAPRAMEKL